MPSEFAIPSFGGVVKKCLGRVVSRQSQEIKLRAQVKCQNE